MGAGDFEAGEGLAGHDPVVEETYVIPTRPEAIYFDPLTRSFPQTLDGENVPMHPVDQSVCIIVGVLQASLKASIDTGLNWNKIRSSPRASLQFAITDEVSLKLATLIANGDVQFLGAPLRPDAAGRPFFFVDYVNLRLPPDAPPRRLPVFQ